MRIPTKVSRKLIVASLLVSGMAVTGCSDSDDDEANVRVIHMSKDTPPVNIRVGSSQVISNLDYAESSGYIEIDDGSRDVAVEAIIPGGNADVITVNGFDFEEDEYYNILAVNDRASIEPLVVAETTGDPSGTEVAIAVVHASTNAGAVDVYLSAPGALLNGTLPTFTADFKDVFDAGAIPAGSYQIRVALQGEADPDNNAVYDSGTVDLTGFGGERLLIAAISSVNATDSAQLELLDTNTVVGARVVHLSPDAGTLAGGPVEVFATSAALPGTVELIPAFSYTDIVPAGGASYTTVPAGDYVFNVAPDGAGLPGVYTSPNLTLSTGEEYSVIAAGNVGSAPPAADAFTLLATGDDNRSIDTQASVKVVHAAPAAGLVDVFVTPAGVFSAADVIAGTAGAPLLDDFAFSDITDYVPVAPGNYDIRVIAGGVAAIDIPNFALIPGLVATVIARQPDGDGTPADFNLVVLTN